MSGKEGTTDVEEEKCEYCGTKHKFSKPKGECHGTGGALADNMNIKRDQHPWQFKGKPNPDSKKKDKFERSTIEPHHLIPNVLINREEKTPNQTLYKDLVVKFGWNINSERNGVWLPIIMKLACQLMVPLHRGNHNYTADELGLNYNDKVRNLIAPTMELASEGVYCNTQSDFDAFIAEMYDHSEFIWSQVIAFNWKITSDGKDYEGSGIGCGNCDNIGRKKDTGRELCKKRKDKKNHGFPVGNHQPDIGK